MRISLLALAMVVLLLAPAAWAITINDGGVHVIDAENSLPFDKVFLQQGPGGGRTTLEILPGGRIGTDGLVGGVSASSNTLVIFSGGIIAGGALKVDGTAVLEMSGGEATHFIDAQSKANISGGESSKIVAAGPRAVVTVSGGLFSGSLSLQTINAARVSKLGGTFRGEIRTQHDTVVEILGGAVEGSLLALDESVISVRGSGFNFTYGPIGITSGTLTGVLGDGTPINVSFGRASAARITLACGLVGSILASTPSLAADQDNDCEDWSGVMQPGDDLSRSGLEFVDLSVSDLSGVALTDASLAFADLSGADLSGANVSGTELFGATYNESTLFPSGNTYDTPPWGLDGGLSPWDAGMIPVPEPSGGWLLAAGIAGVIWLGRPLHTGTSL